MELTKEQTLGVWKETGKIIGMQIFNDLREILGNEVFSRFEEYIQWLADYEELWIFTNINQIQKCNSSWFNEEDRTKCQLQFLSEGVAWFVIGIPYEH